MIVLQHIWYNVLMEHPHLLGNGHSLLLQHLKIHLHSHPLVTSKTDQHFVKHNSDCPNITLLRIFVLSVSFRRHVFRRAYIIKYLRFVWHLLHLAIPKVNDCDLFTLIRMPFEKNIIRFQVSVNYLLCFHMLITLHNLSKDMDSLVFRQTIWMLLNILSKSSSLQQFHYHVQVIFFYHYLNQFNDVLMTWMFNFA